MEKVCTALCLLCVPKHTEEYLCGIFQKVVISNNDIAGAKAEKK